MAKKKSESLRIGDKYDLVEIVTPKDQTNMWFMGKVLGVDKLDCEADPEKQIIRYRCVVPKIAKPLRIDLPADISLEEKVNALRLALRMHHGNHYQGEESRHTAAKKS